MFYDLSQPADDVEMLVRRDRLLMASSLGYDCVAGSHITQGKVTDSDRCTVNTNPVPQGPSDSGILRLLRLRDGKTPEKQQQQQWKQLTRLELVANDPTQAQTLGNEQVVRTYDIISIQPQTDRLLQQACNSLDVDVITFDLAQKLPFKLKPDILQAGAARGIHFEICYAAALREASMRRTVFSNAQLLCWALRGKNVIISSGARNSMELRGPHDVINMATLFGLTEAQAKAAISDRCQAVINKANLRKFHRGVLRIEPCPTLESLAGPGPGSAAPPAGAAAQDPPSKAGQGPVDPLQGKGAGAAARKRQGAQAGGAGNDNKKQRVKRI